MCWLQSECSSTGGSGGLQLHRLLWLAVQFAHTCSPSKQQFSDTRAQLASQPELISRALCSQARRGRWRQQWVRASGIISRLYWLSSQPDWSQCADRLSLHSTCTVWLGAVWCLVCSPLHNPLFLPFSITYSPHSTKTPVFGQVIWSPASSLGLVPTRNNMDLSQTNIFETR